MNPELVIQDFQGRLNADPNGNSARLIKGVFKTLAQTPFTDLLFGMRESWKSIKGWIGYEVSSEGRVRSFWMPVWAKGRRGRSYVIGPSPSIIRLKSNREGRLSVVLHSEGIRKTFSVQTLVLEAFVGPRPHGMFACHGPKGLPDNSISNLYWALPSRNNGQDRRRDKTAMFGELHPRAKLTEKTVRWIISEREKGKTRHAIAAVLGVAPSTVGSVIYGLNWKYITQ